LAAALGNRTDFLKELGN